jgi:hypothetical protein
LQTVASAAKTAGVEDEDLVNLEPVFIFDDGDTFRLDGLLLNPLPGFANKKTSINSDHYHGVTMIDDIVTGKIKSFGDRNASFVEIEVEDTYNFDNPLVQLQGDLFENAQIVFTNEDSYNLRYVSEVVSHTATTITVRIKSLDFWNFDAADTNNISVGWNWRIDAYNYGYTQGITYENFVVKKSFVTQQIDRGDTTVVIEDTSGIVIGDKIRLQDDTLSFEINSVKSIIDAVTVEVNTPVSRTYFLNRNPQLRVLRNDFGNTHMHQIRNNEVELLYIESYLDNGYPSEHSHLVEPLLLEVSQMLNRSGEIIAVGSDERIYSSFDEGATWAEIANLNNFTEGDVGVQSITTAILKGDDGIIAGAANGRIFVEGINDGTVVPIVAPSVT